MCVRYAAHVIEARLLDVELNRLDAEMFPGSPATIVGVGEGRAQPMLATWGIVPAWAKDGAFGKHTYNARAETVAEKPSFRDAYRKRRCLVPATEFYERGAGRWLRFHAPNNGLFVLAGLWEPSNVISPSPTFTVITTEPNSLVEPYQDRMPVLLDEVDSGLWVNVGTPLAALPALLKPCPPDWLQVEDAGPIGRRA
jgi:putative SOS response-associated peptidase YedK